MIQILRLRRLLAKAVSDMRPHIVVGAVLCYGLISWLGLYLSGEKELVEMPRFIYFLVVTASTVGYGDFSPATTAGQQFTSFVVIPMGLGLFATVLGRLAGWTIEQWRRGIMGLKTLELDNHILVIGWNGKRTEDLVKLLHADESQRAAPREIVLCVREEMESPFPAYAEFVRVSNFADREQMAKTSLASASAVVIDLSCDNETLTTGLLVNHVNEQAHVVAYFQNDSMADLLRSHCPRVNCIPSVSVDLLARATMDPGSESVHKCLLNVTEGQTQYSHVLSEDEVDETCDTVGELTAQWKRRLNALVIGLRESCDAPLVLNPGAQHPVRPGNVIYYISDKRI